MRRLARGIKRRVAAALGQPAQQSAASPAQTATTFAAEFANLLGAETILAVDVGGAHGLQPHWHKLVGSVDFVVYEPHEASRQTLLEQQRADARYARFRYLGHALSGQPGERTLYKTNVPTGSSLRRPKRGSIHDYAENTYFWPVVEEPIATTTLALSLDAEKVGRVDMIKLDTQGTELEILSGLDEARLSGTLLVEAELGLLDAYEGEETALEDAFRFMRAKGFTIFDLRTNRIAGNAARLPVGEIERWLGPDIEMPPNALRLGEVDAIFARDPRHLINGGVNGGTVRRFVAILATYHFLSEAVFTVRYAQEKGCLSATEAEAMLGSIQQIHGLYAGETTDVVQAIRRNRGRVWAQYMWVPSPSA